MTSKLSSLAGKVGKMQVLGKSIDSYTPRKIEAKRNVNETTNTANITGVGDVKVILPYDIKELIELTVKEEINSHGTLEVTCIVDESSYKKIISSSSEGEAIVAINQSKTIFVGLVTNIKVRCIRDVYYLDVKAKSFTNELDIVKRTRIFPSGDMSHRQIIDYVLSPYKGVNYITKLAKKSNYMVVQYKETDWEFIKRLASQENLGLIPDSVGESPRFCIGCMDKGEISKVEYLEYSIKKDLEKFHRLNMNTENSLNEQDFKCITFKSMTPLNILDKVDFSGEAFFISKVKGEITKAGLEYSYEAGKEAIFMQSPIIHKNLIGASFIGSVGSISKDEITVNFPMDKGGQSISLKYLTPFSLEGDYGWHIMPESGDTVTVQFPTENEEDAYALTSNFMSGGDSSTKSLSTPYGKSMSLAPSGITFSSNAGHSISISDGGVSISSSSDVNISGESNVNINGGNISASAGDMMQLISGGISIIMDGNTHSIGANVRIN